MASPRGALAQNCKEIANECHARVMALIGDVAFFNLSDQRDEPLSPLCR